MKISENKKTKRDLSRDQQWVSSNECIFTYIP